MVTRCSRWKSAPWRLTDCECVEIANFSPSPDLPCTVSGTERDTRTVRRRSLYRKLMSDIFGGCFLSDDTAKQGLRITPGGSVGRTGKRGRLSARGLSRMPKRAENATVKVPPLNQWG